MIKQIFLEKKISLVLIIIIILCIFIESFFLGTSKKENNPIDVKKVQTDIMNNVNNTFISPDSTIKDIEKVLGYQTINSTYIVGKDSYIRESLSKEIIKKYKLEDYAARQEQYYKRIEKEYLENLKVTLGQTGIYNGEDVHQEVKIVSFYYGMYIADLIELESILVSEKINNDTLDIQAGSKEEAEYYKCRVDAMGILDKHFDTYVNREEEVSVEIIYKDGQPKNSDEAFTLLCGITGVTYSNAHFAEEEVQKAQQERLDGYLKELQVE